MINSASIFNCSFLNMKSDTDQLVEGGVKMFHVDIMDGHYVPNLCLSFKLLEELKAAYPQIQTDVHIMVSNPLEYVERLRESGADYVSFHTDSTHMVRRTVQQIQKAGMKAGIVINPSQRIDHIEPYIHDVDMVMLMAVEPGFSGQPFLEGGMERLALLADLRRRHNCRFLINVDGGINPERARRCQALGVDIIVGTVHNIFRQPDGIVEACRRFEREFG